MYQTINLKYIYGKGMFGNRMEVFVGGYSQNPSINEEFREQFIKYSKVFDDSLTDEEIDKYWNKMLSAKNRGKKLKNIKVKRIIFYRR